MQTIIDNVRKHIDSHQTAGRDWPSDATYAVEYQVKAWPTSFDRHVVFFTNASDLRAWYAAKCNWALLEGNEFKLDALWMWDLGPQLIADHEPHLRPRNHFHVNCSCGFVGHTVTDNDRGGWEVCPNCGML